MTDAQREKLARAIHERYRERQQGVKAADDPAMQPWEQLRGDLKDSNRQQAEQIPDKLKAIGYDLRAAAARHQAHMALTSDELEMLARREHGRWMSQKIVQGWTYGPEKDDGRKFHPCLVPWEELPEEEKDKDRQVVRQLPELLAETGFEIYKLS